MEEVLMGSVWEWTSPAHDVVKLRTAARCWNEGNKRGLLGGFFFSMLEMDQYERLGFPDQPGSQS